jgi:hypothetical protein
VKFQLEKVKRFFLIGDTRKPTVGIEINWRKYSFPKSLGALGAG